MINLIQLTPAELRTMGIDAIIDAVLEGQTYTEMDPLVKDKFGNNLNHAWRVRDSLTGNLISTHRVTWSYYDAKEGTVDEIITEDAKEIATVKHTLDGKQPTMKKEKKPIGTKKLIAQPIGEL